MNLNTLVEILETAPAQTPLNSGQTPATLAAAIQILDGYSGDHMSVQKIVAILKQSIARVEGLAAAKVHVKFSPKIQGLRIYEINTPEITVCGVVVQLQEAAAACKPARAAGSNCESLPSPTVLVISKVMYKYNHEPATAS